MNIIRKIFHLTSIELRRTLRQSKNLFFILILLLLVGNLFLMVKSGSNLPMKTLALVVEDDSLEVKTFLSNITDNRLKGIIGFEKLDMDSGRKALEEGRIIGLFHVKKGLFENLDRGERESLELYITDPNDPVSAFLIKYIDNLTQVLNEAQNSAMIYLQQMRSSQLSDAEIQKEFSKIQVEYVTAFLTRNTVFTEAPPLDNYFGAGLLSYYYFSAVLILLFFFASALNISLKADLHQGRISRMFICGHGFTTVYLPKIIASAILLMGWIVFTKIVHFLLLRQAFHPRDVLSYLPTALLMAFFIQLLVITLMRYTLRSPFFDWLYAGALFLLFLVSGLILPLPALGRYFTLMERVNPITMTHRLLMGAGIDLFSLGFLLIVCLGLWTLLYLKEER